MSHRHIGPRPDAGPIAACPSPLTRHGLILAALLAGGSLIAAPTAAQTGTAPERAGDGPSNTAPQGTQSVDSTPATALFAGGCFWCVEEAFDTVPGVLETVSGFAGGTTEAPTYQQVTGGRTGHAEVVQVRYDPAEVDYGTLLNTFWTNVDPFDAGGQFCDRGDSYRSAIFPLTDRQTALAEASRQAVAERFDREIATRIEDVGTGFTAAATYHQDYYDKNPVRYTFYKWSCGRQARLDEVWGEAPDGPLVPAEGS